MTHAAFSGLVCNSRFVGLANMACNADKVCKDYRLFALKKSVLDFEYYILPFSLYFFISYSLKIRKMEIGTTT
jgi:hypothetical protein